MPTLAYETKKLGPDKLAIIRRANTILDTYAEQGFVLTLRQVYYQFVAARPSPARRAAGTTSRSSSTETAHDET